MISLLISMIRQIYMLNVITFTMAFAHQKSVVQLKACKMIHFFLIGISDDVQNGICYS